MIQSELKVFSVTTYLFPMEFNVPEILCEICLMNRHASTWYADKGWIIIYKGRENCVKYIFICSWKSDCVCDNVFSTEHRVYPKRYIDISYLHLLL